MVQGRRSEASGAAGSTYNSVGARVWVSALVARFLVRVHVRLLCPQHTRRCDQ